MNDILISKLRDKNTDMRSFREVSDKITHSLAQEALSHLETEEIDIETPIASTKGVKQKNPVTLIPILRSGLAFLPIFLYYFPEASVGFMGLKRDEKTAIASEYYRNLPKISKQHQVLVLDPMIATGGSGVDTLQALTETGLAQEQIVFVGLVAAPEGLGLLQQKFPKVEIITAAIDDHLNSAKYIVPGIGDFGDRYFGTK